MNSAYICFPEGKFKVLTMSYDDGRVEDRKLVEIFNRHGIKGTFHVNSGLDQMENRIPKEEYKELYKNHEVAIHTVTHPTISRCPLEEVITEVLEDRKALERVMGYPVRGMSYPNGSYTKEIKELLPALGVRYSRVVLTTGTFQMPEDFYEWKGTCHHNDSLIEQGKKFLDLNKSQYLYMFYVWGHSYEFTDRENWELMDNFCQLVGKKEDIWYATNIEIVNYIDAAISFPQNRLRLENKIHADEGQKANYVYWCKEEFPENVYIRFNFWPVREPGLCMLFFSGKGKDGEDIFDPSLEKRTGEYVQYHHGDINAFHVSYFRRKEDSERAFHTCNLRKSYGFHLTVQGGDPIPDVIDATPPYEIAVLKYKQDVYFFINDLEIFHFSDDGNTYGPLLKGGKIGFRQLAPFIGEYADLEVYAL